MESRRQFLAVLAAASTAAVLHARPSPAAEGPPEVTTIRFTKLPAVCLAPQYIAEDLLRAEGFQGDPLRRHGGREYRPGHRPRRSRYQ